LFNQESHQEQESNFETQEQSSRGKIQTPYISNAHAVLQRGVHQR